MISTAQELAALLTATAAGAVPAGPHHDDAHAGAAAHCAAGVSGAAVPEAAAATAGAALDMQRIFRLLTLDTIGLTSLNQSFDSLELWRQQQQHQRGLEQQENNSSSSSRSSSSSHSIGVSSSSSPTSQLDLEQGLWDLEAAFLWQSLQLPVPRKYICQPVSGLRVWPELMPVCTLEGPFCCGRC